MQNKNEPNRRFKGWHIKTARNYQPENPANKTPVDSPTKKSTSASSNSSGNKEGLEESYFQPLNTSRVDTKSQNQNTTLFNLNQTEEEEKVHLLKPSYHANKADKTIESRIDDLFKTYYHPQKKYIPKKVREAIYNLRKLLEDKDFSNSPLKNSAIKDIKDTINIIEKSLNKFLTTKVTFLSASQRANFSKMIIKDKLYYDPARRALVTYQNDKLTYYLMKREYSENSQAYVALVNKMIQKDRISYRTLESAFRCFSIDDIMGKYKASEVREFVENLEINFNLLVFSINTLSKGLNSRINKVEDEIIRSNIKEEHALLTFFRKISKEDLHSRQRFIMDGIKKCVLDQGVLIKPDSEFIMLVLKFIACINPVKTLNKKINQNKVGTEFSRGSWAKPLRDLLDLAMLEDHEINTKLDILVGTVFTRRGGTEVTFKKKYAKHFKEAIFIARKLLPSSLLPSSDSTQLDISSVIIDIPLTFEDVKSILHELSGEITALYELLENREGLGGILKDGFDFLTDDCCSPPNFFKYLKSPANLLWKGAKLGFQMWLSAEVVGAVKGWIEGEKPNFENFDSYICNVNPNSLECREYIKWLNQSINDALKQFDPTTCANNSSDYRCNYFQQGYDTANKTLTLIMEQRAREFDKNYSDTTQRYDNQISNITLSYEQDIANITSTYDAAIQNMTLTNQQIISDLKEENQKKLDSLTQSFLAQTASLNATHQSEMNTLILNHAQEIVALNQTHQLDLNNLTQTYEQQIANMEAAQALALVAKFNDGKAAGKATTLTAVSSYANRANNKAAAADSYTYITEWPNSSDTTDLDVMAVLQIIRQAISGALANYGL